MSSHPIAVPLMLGAGLLLGFTVGTLAGPSPPPVGTAVAPGFAVVELFTSEGCSSCPPADVTLDDLGRAARAERSQVFTLAFHVDYWDSLGWPDPFGSALATERQRRYASRWGSRRVYTPQMVVNGRVEFVGSDTDQAKLTVASALATPALVKLELQGEAHTGKLRWRVEGAPPGLVLNLALVEGGLLIAVPRGENEGRELKHDNVVRAFASLPLTATEGEATLVVPANARKENLRMIGYLQDPESMAILGAARL